MESWFYWIHLLILCRNIWADPPAPLRYTVHHAQVSFDRALEACSPGVLTTFATEQEVADVLALVSESASPLRQNEFTFWVGLRKVKNECVVPTLPLRGFKWTEDGSEDSQVSRWTEEPKPTCTTVRCAALKGELDRSTVTRWGLIPVTCKNSYQFICKTSVKPATPEPEPAAPEPEPATLEPEPAVPKPEPAVPKPEPATLEPEPAVLKPEPESASPEPPKLGPEPAAPEAEPTTPGPPKSESKLPDQGPKPGTDPTPKTGPGLQEPDPDGGSKPAQGTCQVPPIPGSRSISLDRDNSSRIQVECWSSVQLELRCSGRPAAWRLLDDSPANFTTICLPCEDGFQKDASGNCVDIDECSSGGGASCRHSCLNTEGSYRCFCSDENGKHHDEDSPECTDTATSSILILVLVVMAALVVLVVVVAVMVKCCLMRRSKKRAMRKAEKMVMTSKDGKDSFQTASEKVAT